MGRKERRGHFRASDQLQARVREAEVAMEERAAGGVAEAAMEDRYRQVKRQLGDARARIADLEDQLAGRAPRDRSRALEAALETHEAAAEHAEKANRHLSAVVGTLEASLIDLQQENDSLRSRLAADGGQPAPPQHPQPTSALRTLEREAEQTEAKLRSALTRCTELSLRVQALESTHAAEDESYTNLLIDLLHRGKTATDRLQQALDSKEVALNGAHAVIGSLQHQQHSADPVRSSVDVLDRARGADGPTAVIDEMMAEIVLLRAEARSLRLRSRELLAGQAWPEPAAATIAELTADLNRQDAALSQREALIDAMQLKLATMPTFEVCADDEEVERRMAQLTADIDDLQASRAQATAQLVMKQRHLNSAADRVAVLEGRVDAANHTTELLKQLLEENTDVFLHEDDEDVERRMAQLTADIDDLQASRAQAMAQLVVKQRHLDSAADRVGPREDDEDAERRMAQLTADIDDLQASRAQAVAQLVVKQRHLDSAADRVGPREDDEDAERRMAQLTADIDDLQASRAQAMAQLVVKQRHLDSAADRVAALEGRVDAANHTTELLKQLLEEKADALNLLKRQLAIGADEDPADEPAKDLDAVISLLESHDDALKILNVHTGREMKALEWNLREVTEACKEKDLALVDMQKSRHLNGQEIAGLKAEVQQAARALEAERAKRRDMEHEMIRFTGTITAAHSNIDELRRQLDERGRDLHVAEETAQRIEDAARRHGVHDVDTIKHDLKSKSNRLAELQRENEVRNSFFFSHMQCVRKLNRPSWTF
ncbi:hypothetical protein DIPPA_11679 [Diplonema papillatum]|nr:hypothetical protein DIPPA_11679 [Diplonema papillatum]